MLLFEELNRISHSIGYMTQGKGMAPFHAMAGSKQIAQEKMLMSQILI